MEQTIEQLLETMYSTREEIRELDAQKSDKQKVYDEAEYLLVQKMDDAGIRAAGIDQCTCSLKREMYPQVQDVDLFVNWCASNGYSTMVQKRINKKVFDEFYEQNNEFPEGVDTYEKTSVLLRKR